MTTPKRAASDRGQFVTGSSRLATLFEASEGLLGRDLPGYRNHAYRVLNFALALAPDAPDARTKLELACYFHDLGIWTDDTFDYLEPSAERAREYLRRHDLTDWSDEMTSMITEHHKITSAAARGELVEAFRQADLCDVSLGMIKADIPRSFIREVKRAFPNRGFHRRLVELTLRRARRHPLSPLPMIKL